MVDCLIGIPLYVIPFFSLAALCLLIIQLYCVSVQLCAGLTYLRYFWAFWIEHLFLFWNFSVIIALVRLCPFLFLSFFWNSHNMTIFTFLLCPISHVGIFHSFFSFVSSFHHFLLETFEVLHCNDYIEILDFNIFCLFQYECF